MRDGAVLRLCGAAHHIRIAPMDISDLSATEQEALRSILRYWAEHWDWESPTLFGMQRDEFTDVLGQWPHCLTQNERAASLALVGAVREFLHGASAVKKEHVKNVTGLSYADAEELMEKLLPRIERALEGE